MSNYIPNPNNNMVFNAAMQPMNGYGVPAQQAIPNVQMGGYYGGAVATAPAPAPATPPVAPMTPAFGGIGMNPNPYNVYAQPPVPPIMGSQGSMLTPDYRKLLVDAAQQTLTISDEKFAQGQCDHKNADGSIAAVIDTQTHMARCPICKAEFKITALDKDRCEKACDDLVTQFNSVKLLNINTPNEVMRQLSDAFTIIDNTFPKVATNVYNTWTNAYKNGMAKYSQNGANPYYRNSINYGGNNAANMMGAVQSGAINGYNPYMNVQQSYNPYNGFAQPATMQVAQPAMNYGTNAYGANAFVNNMPTPSAMNIAQPQQNYNPFNGFAQPVMQTQVAQPAMMVGNTITPAGIVSGVSAAAQQAAQNVVIPGGTTAAQPTATATTPTTAENKTSATPTPDVGKLGV